MSKRWRIYLVGGARPNFMKIAPLWHSLKRRGEQFETQIVHTGQHYDYEMSEVFFKNLGLDLSAVTEALDLVEDFDASVYSAPELWDGNAARRIVEVIGDFLSGTAKENRP